MSSFAAVRTKPDHWVAFIESSANVTVSATGVVVGSGVLRRSKVARTARVSMSPSKASGARAQQYRRSQIVLEGGERDVESHVAAETQRKTARDIPSFAGVAPPELRLYPVETHIAEKLHAYTMPRSRPNSRVKDLPDLALLATVQAIDGRRLRAALDQAFTFRKTHALPMSLPAPPPAWELPYAAMAREDRLAWPSLADVSRAVQIFIDLILAGVCDAAWNPTTWSWGAS